MKILFLTVGPFSNVNRNLMNAFIENQQVITHIDAYNAIDIRLFKFSALLDLLLSFIKGKKKWGIRQHMSVYSFKKMTRLCDKAIHECTDYDLIFQTQTLFAPSFRQLIKPYVIYTDNTFKVSEIYYPEWLPGWSPKERKEMYRMERNAYQRADKIFTYNEIIKRSFVEDYDIASEKVFCVGAGVNYKNIVEYDKSFNKTILFVSTDFSRHGGNNVLKAFEIVRSKINDARLIVVGKKLYNEPLSVVSYDFLAHDELEPIYKKSSIFVLPAKIGGVQALLEAMAHKCVCIVSQENPLAFGIVNHGETGFLLRTNDVCEIARTIIGLFNEEALMGRIGDNSFYRVRDNYTWDILARKMLSEMRQITNVEGEVMSNKRSI